MIFSNVNSLSMQVFVVPCKYCVSISSLFFLAKWLVHRNFYSLFPSCLNLLESIPTYFYAQHYNHHCSKELAVKLMLVEKQLDISSFVHSQHKMPSPIYFQIICISIPMFIPNTTHAFGNLTSTKLESAQVFLSEYGLVSNDHFNQLAWTSRK